MKHFVPFPLTTQHRSIYSCTTDRSSMYACACDCGGHLSVSLISDCVVHSNVCAVHSPCVFILPCLLLSKTFSIVFLCSLIPDLFLSLPNPSTPMAQFTLYHGTLPHPTPILSNLHYCGLCSWPYWFFGWALAEGLI